MIEKELEERQSAERHAAAACFDDFYRDSYSRLVRLAFLLTGSDAAEELVQDCFMRAHVRWDTIESPTAYMRTAVTHACKSQLRRWRTERATASAVAGRTDTVDLEIIELRASLLRLPYRQRAAIVLRFYLQLDDDEIASVLGCKPATVRSIIHRTLPRLRQEVTR